MSLDRRPRGVTLIVLLTLLIVGAQDISNAGVARADYTITWCENGGSEPPVVNSDYSAIEYSCTTNPSAVFLDGVSREVSPSEYNGMLAVGRHKVILDAPSGITISSLTATLVSEIQKSGSSTYVEVGDDDGSLYSQEISRQGATISHVSQTLPGGDASVWLGDFCTPNQNVACYFASPYEILTIKGLGLTLHDNELPSLSLTGGRLLLPGSQSGTADVTFSASAHQSGIAEVDAYLGSTLVGRNAYQSTQCSYTQFDPCPREVSDDLKVDTRWVADGTYPLILEASDASGNTVSVESGDEVTVANDASPAGASQGAGSQASSSAPGAANGRGATTKAEIAYPSGLHGKITVPDGQSTSVSGRLTNQTGTPIPDATLDVLYQTAGSSEPFVLGGHATTNPNGVYTFQVAPGPSRVIRTGYRAFANDSGYDATADLTENVTAATRLKVTPSRLRGRTFMFYGQVHGGNFPPGQQVEIKVLVGNTWTHVTFAPVAANGEFKVRYRLKHRYNHVTFIFRAKPVASPIWPYEPKESNQAYLHLL
jgi:hypothetical protein